MVVEENFTSLAQKYMDTVFRLAFSYLKSRADADDVTQNVLLALYRTDKAFESEAHVKNWLIRVTINECKKFGDRLGGEPRTSTLTSPRSPLRIGTAARCSTRSWRWIKNTAQ